MDKILLTLSFSALLSGSALAQTENSLCHHAGLTYSPGSMLSLGKSFLKCTAAESGVSMWVPATEEDIAVNSANQPFLADGRGAAQMVLVMWTSWHSTKGRIQP